MNKENENPNNPSAFPFVVEYHRHTGLNKGMTLRDYFAAKAMCAAIANPDIKGIDNEIIAKAAYKMADDMLKQRDQ